MWVFSYLAKGMAFFGGGVHNLAIIVIQVIVALQNNIPADGVVRSCSWNRTEHLLCNILHHNLLPHIS